MLTVRREQINVFGATVLALYEQSLLAHFQLHYPREFRLAGNDSMLRLVRSSIARAQKQGFTSQRDVALYANLTMMLGLDFDRDPQIPWAGRQLADPRITLKFRRIQGLFQAAVSYLGQVAGESNRAIAKAMIRIRDYKLQESDKVKPDELPTYLAGLLRRFYPEKFDTQGDKANQELIHLAAETARNRFGFSSPRGVTLFTGLAFMLGIGFASDPLYPWAGAVLDTRAPGTEDSRIDRLYAEAMRYLDASLNLDQEHGSQE
jgi:hypothetical protein